jgi:hypothetical protein
MEQAILFIDPEAKTKIALAKVPKDASGNPYYIGKIQFPGTMEFENGVSFMVFLSEDGLEELQIAPIDPLRRNKSGNGASLNNGRFSIDLHPMFDQRGEKYYVGEAIGLTEIKLHKGIFFTVFVSRAGQEQIQISRLQYKPRPKFQEEPFNINDASNFDREYMVANSR